ncbi:GNAT family N-acetyltransferase [Terracidiphilus gabretensis]|uniref:GNAT family N-acetyltransferase n=1 Tax=Terracidiphilus gabretensis TaxID=1577687 RepID=UPI00071BB71C|nr:GNAT family N-acetyltransferase [Terracidiphilus gabretensis]
MSTEVRVRVMDAADVDAVTALAAKLPMAPQWQLDAYLAALDPQTSPVRIALVAETAPRVLIGFTVASVIPPEAELESIAVVWEFQRRGVAWRLFEALTDKLAAAGVTKVLLEVRASNAAALSLYRVLGFAETGRRPGYYVHPPEDAVQMQRGIQ